MKGQKSTNEKLTKPLIQTPKYFSGASIRKKRKQLGFSQGAFAKCLGVSTATISNWEKKGRYKLNLREKTQDALQDLWKQ